MTAFARRMKKMVGNTRTKAGNSPLRSFKEPLVLLGLFFGLFLVSVIVHEVGHILAALIMGVRPNEIVISWWQGIGPGVTIPGSTALKEVSYFRYAGGIIAASVLLSAYVVFWIHSLRTKTPTGWNKLRWWTGLFLLIWAIFQLYNGFIEGTHFQRYATNPAPISLALLVSIPQSLVIHCCMTFLMRKRNVAGF